jgi:hypothetical protein
LGFLQKKKKMASPYGAWGEEALQEGSGWTIQDDGKVF